MKNDVGEQPKYRAAIWDFDGTLADSLPSAVASFNNLAGEFGFRPITDVERARKMPRKELLTAHRVRWYQLPGLVRRLRREHRRNGEEVQPCHGVLAVVQQLAAAGVTQVVLSSNAVDNIARFLHRHELAGHFAFVIGGVRLRGKRRALARLIRKHDFTTTDCLMIGDEQRDIRAAHRVGVDMAAVTWGMQHRDVLATSAPRFLVETPPELSALFGL